MIHPSLSISGLQIIPEAMLSEYTTFRLGGACKALINCPSPEELELAVRLLVKNRLPYLLIGGGSNLLISDKGINCYVVRYCSAEPILHRDGETIIVSGSTSLDHLAIFAMQEGLAGINYASGIPGTVGGAIVGNAGAWGKQIGDIVESVILINKHGEKGIVRAADLGFTYRHSHLKETGDIILYATIRLAQGDKADLVKEREEILALRHDKHPDLKSFPCAGSFFRNIEPTSKAQRRQAAGFFLEQAGAKTMAVGGAAVFEKHANIIVKTPGCKAQDVYELSKKMAQAVKQQAGLTLIREVRLVGEFDGVSNDTLVW